MPQDTSVEFERRLRARFNLPEDDDVADAMLDAASYFLESGFMEAIALGGIAHDLLCDRCGRLHTTDTCPA